MRAWDHLRSFGIGITRPLGKGGWGVVGFAQEDINDTVRSNGVGQLLIVCYPWVDAFQDHAGQRLFIRARPDARCELEDIPISFDDVLLEVVKPKCEILGILGSASQDVVTSW
jgi:hypothetical protein